MIAHEESTHNFALMKHQISISRARQYIVKYYVIFIDFNIAIRSINVTVPLLFCCGTLNSQGNENNTIGGERVLLLYRKSPIFLKAWSTSRRCLDSVCRGKEFYICRAFAENCLNWLRGYTFTVQLKEGVQP